MRRWQPLKPKKKVAGPRYNALQKNVAMATIQFKRDVLVCLLLSLFNSIFIVFLRFFLKKNLLVTIQLNKKDGNF